MTRLLCFIFTILSIGLLAAGYFLPGQFWVAGAILAFGIFYIVALALRWIWVSRLGLFVFFGVAAFGLFLDFLAPLLVTSAFFALISWDLAEFQNRLDGVPSEGNYAALEKSHLARLFVFALIGGGLTAFALIVRFKLSFEVMVVLVFFAFWGMVGMVNWLIKKGS